MPGGGKGGGASSTVTVHNGPVSVDSDSTVEVVGLNDIKVTARLEPTPLKTESKQELILPQPLKSETRLDTKSESDSRNALSVDLKPVVMDLCLNTSSALPQGQICQPFNFHLGLTWFGMEFFGLNFGGESRTVLQDLPKRAAVEWPAQQNATPAQAPQDAAPTASTGPASRGQAYTSRAGGLRIRIK
jgi:hypothetical protein